MITSVFDKTRPLNYLLLGIILFFSYTGYYAFTGLLAFTAVSIGLFLFNFIVILSSLALLNFVVLKNNLSKNNTYTPLIVILFFLFFPSSFQNTPLLLANFFILLAIRRLVSLKSLKNIKEKLLDASIWITVASLFHFWSLLFLVLVFIAIAFYASRDLKNWLIPFIGFFVVFILASMANIILNHAIVESLKEQITTSFNLFYFKNTIENIGFSVYAAFSILFFANLLFILKSKMLSLQSSFKMIIFSFIIALLVFGISNNKSNALLIFSFAPVAIMATNYIEMVDNKIIKEILAVLLGVLGITFYIFSILQFTPVS